MSTKLDKSLDELISSGPRGGGRRGSGGGRGGGRGRGRGRRQNGGSSNGGGGSFVNPLDRTADDGDFGGESSGPERREGAARRARNSAAPYARNGGGSDGAWSHDMYDGSGGGGAGARGRATGGETRMQAGQSVLVQNLDTEVDENDVHEIFQQMGGVVLKEVKLHYDKSGRFSGSAEVSFASRSDAEKVVDEFDGAEVDGRPMHLKLVGSFVSAPRVVRKARPQQQQQQQSYNNGGDSWGEERRPVRRGSFGNGGGGNRRGGGSGRGGSGGQRRGGGSGRNNGGGGGGGGSGRGGRGRRNEKASVSATDLDAELDAYHNSRATETAAAASTGGADGQPSVASTPAATTE